MKLKRLYPLPLFLGAGALSLFPLLRSSDAILFWRGGAYSDLLISHWPNALFVRRAIAEWGQLPLWNPMILSGAPLTADPLAGIWYLPTWLAIALPPGTGFNLLIWLHLAWAGIGCWRLARELELGHAAAVTSGLAFSAGPKLLGHAGLGHVSLLFAVSWTPWALLAARRAAGALAGAALAQGAGPSRLRPGARAGSADPAGPVPDRPLARAALAGLVVGLSFLADPRWYPFLALLTIAVFLWESAHSHVGRRVKALAVGGAVSLAVTAVLSLPLAEFVGLSTRADLQPGESAALSMPVASLIGLLAPELGAWPEWQPYAGAVVLFLAGLAAVGSLRKARFWLGVAIFGLLFALGDATPLYPLLRATVPGVGQLRVPPRSLLLTAFALAMLAGLGVDSLGRLRRGRVGRLVAAVFAGYLVAGAVTWLALADRLPQERVIRVIPWITSGAFLAIAGAWMASRLRERLSPGAFALFLSALLLMDLMLINFTTLRSEPVGTDPTARLVVELLEPHQRAFSPSYSLTQPSAAALGVQTADGVNPLQLASYRDFMQAATGFKQTGYSVTLPPFPDGVVAEPWGFQPDLGRLGLLAVSTIVSAYPLEAVGLEPRGYARGQHLYHNPAVQPRAWLETATGAESVEQLEWTPNRIEIQTSGGGQLVLSEVDYPGWVAAVDGERAPTQTYAGLLRSVELPPGEHTVVFSFRPVSLLAGAVLTALGLLITGSLWIRR